MGRDGRPVLSTSPMWDVVNVDGHGPRPVLLTFPMWDTVNVDGRGQAAGSLDVSRVGHGQRRWAGAGGRSSRRFPCGTWSTSMGGGGRPGLSTFPMWDMVNVESDGAPARRSRR